MKILKSTLFLLVTTFLIITFLGLAVFELFSLEFKNEQDAVVCTWIFLIFVPLAMLLTLTGTIMKRNSENRNWTIVAVTLTVSMTTFLAMLFLTINSVGEWVNQSVVYRNKLDKSTVINKQIYDVGALGVDHKSKRFVQVKPVLLYFNQVILIDTAKINKDQWLTVTEHGKSSGN